MANQAGYNPAAPIKYDSVVYLDVKPYEADTNLSELARKIS